MAESALMATGSSLPLAPLRRRLARLAGRRWRAGVLRPGSALVIAVVVALLNVAAFDWGWELDPLSRMLVAATAGVIVLVWYGRPLRSAWRHRESPFDLAVLVDRHHRLESDLVAALQFEALAEQSAITPSGSPQLRDAVVHYVAESQHLIDINEGLRPAPSLGRVLLALVAVAAAGGVVAAFPHHAAIFARRLLLQPAYYPTATQIDQVLIAGEAVYTRPSTQPTSAGLTIPPLAAAEGDELPLALTWSGVEPANATVQVRYQKSNRVLTLPLLPPATAAAGESAQEPAPASASPAPPTVSETAVQAAAAPAVTNPEVTIAAVLERISEPVTLQFRAGDAWSHPFELRMVPRPVVQLAFEVEPPSYAVGGRLPPAPAVGSRQVRVLQGSNVRLRLEGTNKPLRAAQLRIEDQTWPLEAADATRMIWQLPAVEHPLAPVTESIRLTITAEDTDGLKVTPPLQAWIRMEEDRPPRVTLAALTNLVLPEAAPTLLFSAEDDLGLAEFGLQLTIHRDGAEPRTVTKTLEKFAANPDLPRQSKGKKSFELLPLKLQTGDTVEVVALAIDARGDQAGAVGRSQPLVLEVTDQRGVLTKMLEFDQKSAEQLDTIIERQLGIGGSRP